MERTLIHMIILGSIFGLTKGNSVLPAGPLSAAVGGTVKFTTTLDPTPLAFVSWTVGNGNPIVTFTSDSTKTASRYKDRVTLFTSTGSLELRNVSLNDSGVYTVNILTQAPVALAGIIKLTVQVPASDVIVSTSSTDLVEFSSVHLSCFSSGSSLSFRWFNGSSEVTSSDRVQRSGYNTNLTIISVTQYDQGPFKCLVSNLVSNATSRPVKFTISYGPYNVKISGPTILRRGQSLEMKCLAESVPFASYVWIRDGERVLNNSDVFMKHDVERNATYICEAKNSVTGRLAYGQHHLTVKDKSFPIGGIVGIVLACLVFGGLSAGLIYVGIKKKKQKNRAQSPTDGYNMNDNTASTNKQHSSLALGSS